jgi:hypothetical protein
VKSGGDQAADLVAAGDHGGVAPEAFEVVVGALLLEEDVDDEVDEVQEDPAGLALSLAAQGRVPSARQARSTSSAMARTWRSLLPEQMTK